MIAICKTRFGGGEDRRLGCMKMHRCGGTGAGYADWLAPSGRCVRIRLAEVWFVRRWGGPERASDFDFATSVDMTVVPNASTGSHFGIANRSVHATTQVLILSALGVVFVKLLKDVWIVE
jgi:hypothetical protein